MSDARHERSTTGDNGNWKHELYFDDMLCPRVLAASRKELVSSDSEIMACPFRACGSLLGKMLLIEISSGSPRRCAFQVGDLCAAVCAVAIFSPGMRVSSAA